ncbi:MAG TPA: hypothetical protein VF426_05090 [Marmoricola sp.]
MSYEVVLLIEEALSEGDARQVYSLHEQEAPVHYTVLLPVEDAAAQVEAGIGALGAGEVMAAPTLAMDVEQVQELQSELQQTAEKGLAASLDLLRATGATADGEAVHDEPISALTAKVGAVDAREAIIMTRPHVVAEFFHVDWTSRARRKLGVPVLHLLEHETFDEQAEGYGEEGVTGL